METIHVDFDENTAVVMLNRGVTNALSSQLLGELREVLQSIREHANVHSVVLTSTNEKFFSIGFDIPRLLQLAAIPGHAIAGGCILALCCDWRFIAEGRKLMGLNEVKLGVPVPYPATRILESLVGTRCAREIMETGELFGPDKLQQMGVVDQVLPVEEVLPEAMKTAERLGAHPVDAFAMIKGNRVTPVIEDVLAHLADKQKLFFEHWYSDEARLLLKEAAKKF
jgi:enoyl-CoA hydratase/carnithine racemase